MQESLGRSRILPSDPSRVILKRDNNDADDDDWPETRNNGIREKRR